MNIFLGHITDEGKFNENSFLIDAEFFKLKKTLALYVVDNGNEKRMIDAGETLTVRRISRRAFR